jgi:hypothetical protein
MIFFFCGAAKNGSHFQMLIVKESMEQQGIKYEQVGDVIFHTHDLKAGRRLLDDLDKRTNEIFVCKGHWGAKTERDILLSYENIRIFHIWREIRDVLVSQYYHDMRESRKSYKDFSDFYRRIGRSFLFWQVAYRRTWMPVSGDSRVYSSRFTELKQNFREAASELLAFAGIEGVDLDNLEKRVALDRLREKYDELGGSAFFRRGIVGEHREVINSTIIHEDIAHIENLGDVRFRLHSFFHNFSRNPRALLYYPFPGRELVMFFVRPVLGIYRKIRHKEKTR